MTERRRWIRRAAGAGLAAWVAIASAGNAAAGTSAPAIDLAAPFGDGMVLPRDRDVTLRGVAPAGSQVSVTPGWAPDRPVKGRAAADGRWSVDLATGPAGGPHTITIVAESDADRWTRTLDDVLLGEVWIAGGQSNMQMPVAPRGSLAGVVDWPGEVARARAPGVRFLTVPDASAWRPAAALPADASWIAVEPGTVGDMSAVAWFFAERLHQERGVPVGIIDASVGGTRIEAWMSETAAADQPSLEPWLALVRGERVEPGHVDRWREDREGAAARAARDRDPGMREQWMSSALDDAAWNTVTVGAHWAESPLAGHDGYVWMRRTIEVSPEAVQAAAGPWTLHLGAVDDRDVTWINGTLVGRTEGDGQWNRPRRYVVPAGVIRPGANLIAVRVHDTSGPGGMIGPADAMRLVPGEGSPANGPGAIAIDGRWRFRSTLTQPEVEAPTPRVPARADRNLPTVLFNAMIAPMASFPVDGVIFYQGESNVGDPAYGDLLPALIGDWRRHFRGDAATNMPFLLVQIAPYAYRGEVGAASWVREAQRRTAAAMDGVEVVVTTDLGARHDIHPMAKRPVGERLANLALAGSKDVAPSGDDPGSPGPATIRFAGGEAIVRFDHAGDGLVVRGDGPATHWQLRRADGRWWTATATISGETVRVRSPYVPEPVAVRFGWGPSPEPNLFGSNGLPVTPFTSEAAPPVR